MQIRPSPIVTRFAISAMLPASIVFSIVAIRQEIRIAVVTDLAASRENMYTKSLTSGKDRSVAEPYLRGCRVQQHSALTLSSLVVGVFYILDNPSSLVYN